MKTIADTYGALEHVERLAVQIGSRLIGSTANLQAADYISAVFKQAGLSLETQEFSCPDWAEEYTSLVMDGEPLEAAANTFSPACDLSAPILAVGTPAELESASMAGKILVFYGDLAQGELAAKGAIYVSERDRRIVQLLEKTRPAAIITVNPTLHERWRLIEDFDLEIPSVTVPAYSGLKLLKNPGATVQLKIAARRTPSRSANVIGRLAGEIPERIVLCAHYDTKVDTPGAYDNAAGVATVLTLAGLLSPKKHRHTFEFIAFSGEEGYGLGDMVYARHTGDGFDRVTAAINFDGVGPYTGSTSVACFAASQALEDRVAEIMRTYPGAVRVEPWPASDHYIFYSHGTPSIALGSKGLRDLYHTSSDTYEWISAEKLAEVIRLALEFIEVLDQEDLSWSRPKQQP